MIISKPFLIFSCCQQHDLRKRFIYICMAMMLCLVEPTHARSIHLLPIPQRIELKGAGEYFVLGRSVSVVDPTNCALLQDFLNENKCVQVRKAKQRIVIQLVDSIPEAFDEPLAGYENESYALSVTPNEIRIHAISATGVIRAVQTLQLWNVVRFEIGQRLNYADSCMMRVGLLSQ